MEIQNEKKVKIAIIIIVIILALEIIYVSGMLKSSKNKKQIESENILETIENVKKQNEDLNIETTTTTQNIEKNEERIPEDPRTKPVPPAPKIKK